MTKKELLLSALQQLDHPDDATNDVFLWLESILRYQDPITDEFVDMIEKVLLMVVRTVKEQSYQDKYKETQSLIHYIKQREENEQTSIDEEFEKKLSAL